MTRTSCLRTPKPFNENLSFRAVSFLCGSRTAADVGKEIWLLMRNVFFEDGGVGGSMQTLHPSTCLAGGKVLCVSLALQIM